MTDLALDEQETNYTVEATDRQTVNVFSNDAVVQKRLERLGIIAHRADGYGKFYTVDLNQYSFGVRRKREVSEEQRERMRQNNPFGNKNISPAEKIDTGTLG